VSLGKWSLSLALVLVLAACGAPAPGPTFPPSSTRGAYPGPPATPLPGYPASGAATSGYPAPAAITTVTAGGPVFVTYKDFEITPSLITITVGTTVTFLIESASGAHHRPYNDTPPNVFEAPADLSNGASFSHTFTAAGVVTLRCRDHDTMTATITVTP
jgi:plastocyanin